MPSAERGDNQLYSRNTVPCDRGYLSVRACLRNSRSHPLKQTITNNSTTRTVLQRQQYNNNSTAATVQQRLNTRTKQQQRLNNNTIATVKQQCNNSTTIV